MAGLAGRGRVERKCYLFIWLRKFEVSHDWSPDQLCCLVPHPWNKSENGHWAGDCQGWLSMVYLTPQDRIKPHHDMFCDSDLLWVSFSFGLCINTHFVLIKELQLHSHGRFGVSNQKHKIKAAASSAKPWIQKSLLLKIRDFPVSRGHSWDVPVINHHLPLETVNLGQVLADTEWHREKGNISDFPWLQVRLVMKW